ncbi:MAG: alpha/beta hydrolase fold domain-containing protein [Rhizobiales bacterium]|nr:alpha/beta hydrolase fold domain-containing protein [Hyphomicrobiales bacterium]
MSTLQPDAALQKVKSLLRERAKRAVLPLDERRTMMDRNSEVFPLPAGVEVESIDINGLKADWNRPIGMTDGPVLLYFHGGGYVQGSPLSHRHMTGRLALEGNLRVLSVDYAMAPEQPFPAAVNDGLKSYRWLLDQGVPAGQIALAGDSAGGGLVVATMMMARDSDLPIPACGVLLCPWTDLTCTTESYKTRAAADPMTSEEGLKSMAAIYLNGADPRDPLASPNYGNLKGLPPLYIQVGHDEVLLDDARHLAMRAGEQGVGVRLDVVEDMFHVWQAFYQMLPQAEDALIKIGSYLRQHLGN